MKKQSLFGGFAFLSGAVIISKILSMLYLPFLIAILTDEGWGIYSAAYHVFIVIYAIANSGLPQSIAKIVSELTAVGNYKDALKAFKMSRTILIIIGATLGIIYFALSGFISVAIKYEKAYLAVLALAPTIFLSTINSSYRGFFQGRGNMIPTAASQVIEQIVNIIFTLLLAYLFIGYGMEQAAAGGAFATSIAALAVTIFLVSLYRKNHEWNMVKLHDPDVKRYTNKELIKKIFSYSIPLTAYTAIYNFGNLIDLGNTKSRLLAAGFTDANATILYGYYSKYVQLIGIPNAIIQSLSVALLPAISAAAAKGDKDEVLGKIRMAFKISFSICLPSIVGLTVLSGPIYRLMGLGNGSYIMLYGAYNLILMTSVYLFSTILQGIGKLYIVTSFQIIGIAGKIITNYIAIGIPSINILGAILGNIAYYSIPFTLGYITLSKTLKVKLKVFSHAVKPGISAIAMGVIIYPIYHLLHKVFSLILGGNSYFASAVPTLICIAIGIYSYFYVLVRIKGITSEDMKVLPAKIRRFMPKSIVKHLA